MYLYIYDSFLSQKKFGVFLNRIEGRLTDLEIKGKICRLNILKNMREVIEDAIAQGIKTVVAVGDDVTFSKLVNAVIDLDVTLGFIPVDNKSKIAQILGIPEAEQACEILAQRLIKKLDLGKINQQYFIDSAVIKNSPVTLEFGKYKITPLAKNSLVSICNLGYLTSSPGVYRNISNPTDGFLEVIVENSQGGILGKLKKAYTQSVFPFKKVKIGCEEGAATINIDQLAVFKTPAEITVVPEKLKVIVGSKRLF
jgi:diacylglycerol kinase family enzyme